MPASHYLGFSGQGGGYGSDQGWRGILEVGNDNLFGTGQSASAREKLTKYGDRTDLTYRLPWLLGTPLKGELDLFREYRDQFGYKLDQAGFATGVERTLLPVPFKDLYRLRLGLRYQLAWVRQYDVSSSLETGGADAIVPGSQIVAKISPAVTLDYRDSVVDPISTVSLTSTSCSSRMLAATADSTGNPPVMSFIARVLQAW